MQRTLLILALITAAGASYAQTMEPTDPYGRPLVGRNDWVRQPGDQAGPGGMQSRPQYGESAVMNYGSNMATAPATQPRAAGEKLTRNNKLEGVTRQGRSRSPWMPPVPARPHSRTSTASATTAKAIASMRAETSFHHTYRSGERSADLPRRGRFRG